MGGLNAQTSQSGRIVAAPARENQRQFFKDSEKSFGSETDGRQKICLATPRCQNRGPIPIPLDRAKAGRPRRLWGFAIRRRPAHRVIGDFLQAGVVGFAAAEEGNRGDGVGLAGDG